MTVLCILTIGFFSSQVEFWAAESFQACEQKRAERGATVVAHIYTKEQMDAACGGSDWPACQRAK